MKELSYSFDAEYIIKKKKSLKRQLLADAFYGAQRSPFCFRTAAFRSQRPPIF